LVKRAGIRRFATESHTKSGTPTRSKPPADPPPPASGPTPEAQDAWQAMILAGMESDPTLTPRDMHNTEAWDLYWSNRIELDEMGSSFDWIIPFRFLQRWFSRRGAQRVLCVGNGYSSEPVHLLYIGCHVTALDLATGPEIFFRERAADPTEPPYPFPGVVTSEDGTFHVPGSGALDLAVSPAGGAFLTELPGTAGGSLRYVTGDLTDPSVCPGPFDVVIEHSVGQVFQGYQRTVALNAMAARLATPGLFVSHEHNGRGVRGRHYAKAWAAENGFAELDRRELTPELLAAPRVIDLYRSSG
jgi:hypothetical protein